MRDRRPLRLPADLEPVATSLASDTVLESARITGDTLDGPEGELATDVEITDVRCINVRLTGRRFRRLQCKNVVFEDCDLSGVLAEDSTLDQVEFHRCRLSGIVLAGSTMMDLLFSSCRIDLANLRMSKSNRVQFHDSDLREADFYAARLVNTRIYDSELSRADFSQASAEGMRLHGSTVRDIQGVSALATAVISADQVTELAMALLAASGITVDEQR